jgi:outer membrane receptor protein involved in Fe transport
MLPATHHLMPQDFGEALMELGVQSGLTIADPMSLTVGKRGSSLNGDMASTDAPRILLAGTGLTFARGDDGAIAIQKSEKSADTVTVRNSAVKSDLEKDLTESGGFEDIVVTATRNARGDSLQKVPLAVTALSGATLRERSLNTIKDVGHVSPGVLLNVSAFAGFANFVIRGQGLDGTLLTIEPTVGVVVNELVLGNILDTYDMESVEVLRGPQGVLQGRNATGVTEFPDLARLHAANGQV